MRKNVTYETNCQAKTTFGSILRCGYVEKSTGIP